MNRVMGLSYPLDVYWDISIITQDRTDFDPLAQHAQQIMTKYQRQMLVNNDVTMNWVVKRHYYASPLGINQHNLLVSIPH